jgi:TrwC relaxase/Type IV secretory system Conjugative DNA transfer
MVATWNVAASSAYYARGSEYYLGAKEPDGVWYAPAGDRGRVDAATVQAKEFARLYEGRRADGQALISNAGSKADQRVPAFDLTFSAPRSVCAFADDDLRRNFDAAQERATPGEIMQLQPDDELVLLSDCRPIRAKKARYYEDRRLTERVMAPPKPTAGTTKQLGRTDD